MQIATFLCCITYVVVYKIKRDFDAPLSFENSKMLPISSFQPCLTEGINKFVYLRLILI
jgi:hypothetical protein